MSMLASCVCDIIVIGNDSVIIFLPRITNQQKTEGENKQPKSHSLPWSDIGRWAGSAEVADEDETRIQTTTTR